MKLSGIITGIFAAAILFFGCQKSIIFDPNGPSESTLKNSVTGDCLPSSVNGIYKKDSALTSSEYIDVNLDVTTVGTFLVKTDSINGMSFKGSGVFGQKGNNLVRMYGTGKPLATGTFNFTVTNGYGFCSIAVLVLGPNTGVATYTLGGAGFSCSTFTPSGTYNAGQILVASNSATTNVNVMQTGTYVAKTDTVNGISFKASGNFTNLNIQSITLVGSGTPISTGTYTYTLSTGSTSCTFTITVGGTGAGTSGDYFPLSANSWWSYDAVYGGTPQVDTTVESIVGTHSYNGSIYTEMQYGRSTTIIDTSYYRKNGNDYFDWTFSDSYSDIEFDNIEYVDINFLKQASPTNTTWSSPVYSGKVSGVPTQVQYVFKIENANTSITVNGINYTNIIQESITSMQSQSGGPFTATVTQHTYYAKNIGIVKSTYSDVVSGNTGETNIRHYKVF